ncbi:hypothetical protein JL720_2433 [Aureococcus anophagefferens]|nr:hypothetical protein JL720_2433 [Aureococcus anophagefferens]
MGYTSFEDFRTVTSWVRPARGHGCKPVEILPGLWTAHYHDIDSKEKLKAATKGAPITLVVNSALCQCEARTGFWGPDVQGKPTTSACRDPDVPLEKRCSGDAKQYFDAVNKAVAAALARGDHVLVHCHASLSRSAAFILAYLMQKKGMTLLEAARCMKANWDATWPNDRFVFQLMEYERDLAAPAAAGAAVFAAGLALGAALATLRLRK